MCRKPTRTPWLPQFLFFAVALIFVACGNAGSPSSSSQGAAGSASTPQATNTPTVSASASTGTAKPLLPLKAIRMIDIRNGWALTARSILKTTDGGIHWDDVTPANSGLTQSAVGQFMDVLHAWIAIGPENQQEGLGIALLYTSDGGTTWQQSHVNDALVSQVDVPHFLNQRQGWLEASSSPGAGSARSDIWASHDGGQTWTLISSNKGTAGLRLGYVTGISFHDAQTGIAAGNLGAGGDNSVPSLALTRNGGQTWQTTSLPHLLGGYVDPFNTSQPPVFFGNVVILPVLITVQNSNLLVLYRSNDGGANWFQTSAVHIQATNTYVLDANYVWATDTQSGRLYRTSDGGNHWFSISDGAYHLGALSFPDISSGWGVSGGHLLLTIDGGKTWQQISYSIQ